MKKIIGIAAVALAAAASQAWAQAYPNKPVHVIISFSPGSSTDIVGRVVAQKLAEMWGQPALAARSARRSSPRRRRTAIRCSSIPMRTR